MLSLEECRHLLGNEMTDQEIEEFLADLRKLLGKFIDNYFQDEFREDDLY